MIRFIISRLVHAIPVLFGITVLAFLLVHLIPGDPAKEIAGNDASPEVVAQIRADLGLDRPLYEQYGRYLLQVVQGDLGRSLHTRRPVAQDITDRLPATLELAVAATVIASVVGIPIGVISAVKRYSVFDYVAVLFSLLGISLPLFWTGIMLGWLFGVELQWLPVSGRAGPIWSSLTAWKYLVLPAVTLAGTSMAMISRLTRSSMLEVVRQDFITVARAKGLKENTVIFRHALKNAMLPVITFIGLEVGFLIGGAVVTESIFSWPGLGRFVLSAINSRDYPVIQGIVLFMAVIFVVVNLVVDLLYAALDPRIHYA